jgi:hypothetical protein
MQHISLYGAPNGLLVNKIDTEKSEHDGLWKVSLVYDETPYALTEVAFARRLDAVRAKAAIEPLADWTLPPRQIALQLREKGWTRQAVTQLMAEAIQW